MRTHATGKTSEELVITIVSIGVAVIIGLGLAFAALGAPGSEWVLRNVIEMITPSFSVEFTGQKHWW